MKRNRVAGASGARITGDSQGAQGDWMEQHVQSWEPWWTRLLRIDFFEDQWETYKRVADARAVWLAQTFDLDPAKPVLSLHCGEGGIELALARLGFDVMGLDPSATLISFARDQAAQQKLKATFLSSPIEGDMPIRGGNGAVLCFDTFGLLGEEKETKLATRMISALAPDGTILVDSPAREATFAGRQWWPVAGGQLLRERRWDKDHGVLETEYRFISADGHTVLMTDPWDESREDENSYRRYVFRTGELEQVFKASGLPVHSTQHQRSGYFMVAAGAGAA